MAVSLIMNGGAMAQQTNDSEQVQNVSATKTKRRMADAYIINGWVNKVICVNEEVTTHVIMPEPIKMVDISTNKLAGNQCADNIVRIKPVGKLFDNELVGTITVIGERHIAQYDIIYTARPIQACPLYKIPYRETERYTNPAVAMTEGEMARFAYSIYNSPKKFYNIKADKYGIKIRVNNIYTLNDYFFIDFSLENKTNIKYDIEEMHVKLIDKKQTKATNSQTVELPVVWKLNNANSFKRAYRNILVIDKLTFPNEKVLSLEVSEKQISGRVINLTIDYADILNADSFDQSLIQKTWTQY